jgi:predicted ester cyclase
MREACTEGCVFHFGNAPPASFDTHQGALQPFFEAFPDGRISLDEVIVHGDTVVTRSTYRGTHLRDFKGIAPTGRAVRVVAIEIDRLVDGRIAEHWACGDFLALMQDIQR